MAEKQPTVEDLQAKIRELESKQSAAVDVEFQYAPRSGQISAYFLGRAFPITLPGKLWLRLLEHQDELRAVIERNKAKLAA